MIEKKAVGESRNDSHSYGNTIRLHSPPRQTSCQSCPFPPQSVANLKLLTDDQKHDLIEQMKEEMREATEHLEFERAAELRDSIEEIKEQLES